ncbi:MAG: cytochrome c [Devosia sp.]
MPLSKLTAIASVILVTVAITASAIAQTSPEIVVDPAIAAMTNDELVAARQNAMKQDGGILKGAGGLMGDEAVAAATTLQQNFTNFPALFREGSATADSKALPGVWQNWAIFEGIFAKARLASADMLTAALAGDDSGYQTAIKAIGATCGECHQTFRGR